ncbi:glycosyltransferase [Thermomonas sp.]|uniref:glycosyltransferase n=1 Tax=Thermomonas sp. TaxID=1971895 RepID=UPI0024884DAA|nr:glycosyltransferase [Thermomonas sp.]MDI1254203.1 glycosyltransferase [Thermomonas sp.]
MIGGSAGNEAGHWEDAVAVELHERLLAAMGRRWHDLPVPTPEAIAAAASIDVRPTLAGYLSRDRGTHRNWAVKDPRLSLFAGLWVDAARAPGIHLAGLLMVRDPVEVAQSLAVRDGLSLGQGQLLWLEYTLAAMEQAQGIPLAVSTYDQLMDEPGRVLDRIRLLPGWGALSWDREALQAIIEPSQRHHHSDAERSAELVPLPIRELWKALVSVAHGDGILPVGFAAEWRERLSPFLSLAGSLAAAWRVTEHRLWERVARAEAAPDVHAAVESRISGLELAQQNHHQELVRVLSHDIKGMQETAARHQAAAATAAAHLQAARDAGPALAALADRLGALSDTLASSQQQALEWQQVAVEQRERADALVVQLGERQQSFQALERQLAERQAVVEAHQARLDSQAQVADELQREVGSLKLRSTSLEGELEDVRSNSDSLSAELSALRAKNDLLCLDARTLAYVVRSRSWRWTKPLRAAMRLVRGDWGTNESAILKSLVRRALVRLPGLSKATRVKLIEQSLPMGSRAIAPSSLPDQALATAMHLAPAVEGRADVFVWAVIDWHFRMQRPQHLARSLAARGHRVFYMSNNFVDSAVPGFHLDPLDESGRLFQVHLKQEGAPAIYFGLPDDKQAQALHASLSELLAWTHTRASISLVQHPYWRPLLRSLPNARLVYDCMDHHGGFENNAACVLEAEGAIIRDADLVIVTSSWLEKEIAPIARASAMVRNAGEYEFFSAVPDEVFRDARGRKVIGYYGAIAEWFDLDLIRNLALSLPDVLVLLVGSDTAGAAAALSDVPNVEFTGEVAYSRLPYYLHAFDVALLPFKVLPLTLATNPVKVYEYLAAGKPVVTVDLPEMVQFEGLVKVASAEGFVDAVAEQLTCEADPTQVAARRTFAAGQTWDHRAASLDHALAVIEEPVVSVVVLTYNNLAYTKACLFSIEAYSDYPALEIIVVDNASSDGSAEWLRNWAEEPSAAGHRRRLVLNEENLGFSAGNNVGLAAATGEVLILLNNDTYVTPGWVRTLCAHLRRDPRVGLVGPITNNIGNEARIEIQYSDMVEMIQKAGQYTRAHAGRSIPLHNAAFFCVAMPREVYERVGPMDEDFGIGFFEDDDYCRRVHLEGFQVACAEDVFVHHHLSASFDSLGVERKQILFEKNKAIYEAKWGPWLPHVYRGPRP